ncbi:MAG: ATP-binding cassette domain-containing protein [Pseudomonadota bacterium]
MIELRKLALRRGTNELFSDATLKVPRGASVGVVGRNGCGKSSLFALLLGQLHADEGDLDIPGDINIAHVAQHAPAGERSALDTVLDGDRELRTTETQLQRAEAAGDGLAIATAHGRLEDIDGYAAPARAATILLGLGFREAELALPVASFSGGWRMRLNLAQALIARSDLLMLDEPTNHLDLDAVLWLESWLSNYRGTMLTISHDRDFLDRISDHIVHFESGRVTLYKGDFAAFENQRAATLAQNRALFDRQQRQVAEIQRFVDRFRAKATKARQAQSRLKTLARMERIELAHVDRPFRFEIPTPQKLPNPLLRLEDAAAGYGERTVIDTVALNLTPGSRIGLVGHNGAGKSTLIKLIAGELQPRAGKREVSRGLSVGYFAQHQLEQLDPREGPLTHMRRVAPDEGEQRLRDYIGGFGFPGEMADSSCAHFSGGEKARLVLAMLLWSAPNLLLLDEPTNHLDLDMRDALTSALQRYPGALVSVSHDRHLLDSTTDELWLVHDGAVSWFRGDLDDYREWILKTDRAPLPVAAQPTHPDNSHTTAVRGASAAERKARRQAEAEQRSRRQPLTRRAAKLESDLETLQAARALVEDRLADPALYDDPHKAELKQILHEQTELKRRVDEIETIWLSVLEELESLDQ